MLLLFWLLFLFSNSLEEKTAEERAHSFKHLSKSASELDSRENYTHLSPPSASPQRSGRVAGVLQRTHGFLSTLKVIIFHTVLINAIFFAQWKCGTNDNLQHRWSRGRSKERGYHASHTQHNDGESGAHDSEGTDYTADNSSDHSSSVTHSPRHRPVPVPYSDSPLARTHFAKLEKRDSLSSQHDPSNVDAVRTSITAAQVQISKHLVICHAHLFDNVIGILLGQQCRHTKQMLQLLYMGLIWWGNK